MLRRAVDEVARHHRHTPDVVRLLRRFYNEVDFPATAIRACPDIRLR
jgi:hypothetical protein